MREDERARWTKLVADFESADLSQRAAFIFPAQV
jgi:hypothetical protein